MKTINVSDVGYKRILERKRKMEEEQQRLVFIPEVVDVFLGVTNNV